MVTLLGGSGFLGRNLYEYLQFNFNIENVSLRNLNNLASLESSDVIINLIGKAHDHKGIASEQDYLYSNFELVQKIYATFVSSKASLFIHISSIAAVQESGDKFVITEDSQCMPVSWYGKSKYLAEDFLMQQKPIEGKKVIILRPTMVHGPYDKGNLALLYNIFSKGLPNPLFSYRNRRSFLAIDNFNFFIEEIISNSEKVPSGIYNVCDDEPITITEIAEVISEKTGKKIVNIAVPKWALKCVAKVGDVIPIPLNTNRLIKLTADLVVSNHKIKHVLQIEKLPVSAKEGLNKTICSYSKSE